MTRPLRVFVVEDEALLQMQLEMFLEDAGHEVTGTASSLTEAIKGAARARPDLALVDIHLADGPTGVDVGRHLVSLGIPTVFMTANAARIPEDFSGAIGVISKPYTQGCVLAALGFLVSAVRDDPPLPPVPCSLTLRPDTAHRWGLS